MAKTGTGRGQAPKTCRECSRWPEVREKFRISALVDAALKKLEEKLTTDEFKPTVADYLKLVQLEQELEQEETKEIKVTWVEPGATSPEK
jgi:hypothetical protein